MESRKYQTIDKSTWEQGPWQNEPDKRQWADPDTGLPCLMVRNQYGALCGYVGVPEGHPEFGKHYSDIEVDYEVHGGVTFTGPCRPGATESTGICHTPDKGEPDHVWWIGFDCGHAGDHNPGEGAMLRGYNDGSYELWSKWHAIGTPLPWGPVEYRTAEYVAKQCAHLAKQLVDAKAAP